MAKILTQVIACYFKPVSYDRKLTQRILLGWFSTGVVAHITNSNPALVTIPNDEQVSVLLRGFVDLFVHISDYGQLLTSI